MSIAPLSSDWQNVDSHRNPDSIAGYLGAVTALDVVQAFKRKSFSFLSPQEGHRILDIGCGIGDDVIALAQMVGATGEVIGVDSSQSLIQQARSRPEGTNLPARFEIGDATQLDFADNTFDSCRSDRVFQHLPGRTQALTEMIRVTRPGGRIAVSDTDWGTLVIDMPDMELTARMLPHWAKRHQNGWSGRQLLRLFNEAGLTDLIVESGTAIFTDFALADRVLYLSACVQELEQSGQVSADEGAQWLGYLKEADRRGHFLCTLSGFTVAGRKA